MVYEDAESSDTVSGLPPRRLSSSSSTMSATQEDVVMDLEIKRFEKPRKSVPQRRVSCISSFGRNPNEGMAPLRRESFSGGRRFSVDLSRPGLSKAFKRDREINKSFFEMDVSTRKAGEDTRSLVHDLAVVQTQNHTVSKRINNLLYAAADMRNSHRHIFTQQENNFVPARRGK